MKRLAKPLLWLMTTAIPVFIAACYGAPMDGMWGEDAGSEPEKSVAGRVLAALTGNGIPYIQVSCLVSGYDGLEVYDDTYSSPDDGAFELWTAESMPCELLRFEDVDGAENGAFAAKDVEYANDGTDVIVELDAQD